jgi:hypothetical protein
MRREVAVPTDASIDRTGHLVLSLMEESPQQTDDLSSFPTRDALSSSDVGECDLVLECDPAYGGTVINASDAPYVQNVGV